MHAHQKQVNTLAERLNNLGKERIYGHTWKLLPESAKPVEQLYDRWRPVLMLCSALCRTQQCQPRPKLQDSSTGSRDDWFLHLLKQTYLLQT